jgi:hypothetical protein
MAGLAMMGFPMLVIGCIPPMIGFMNTGALPFGALLKFPPAIGMAPVIIMFPPAMGML